MFDLTTADGVLEYLSATPFAASNAVPLTGGFGNFTYRIFLREPHAATDVEEPVRTLVLKHAAPYLPGNRSFAIHVERQDFEVLAFKHIPQLVHPSPVVSLPKLYYEDREQRAILMADIGDTCSTLKSLLQTAPPTLQVSQTIGQSLGNFLARMHASTLGSRGSEIKAAFSSNQQGRHLSALITYGRLIETIAPQDGEKKIVDPPLDLPSSKLETLAALAKTMQNRVLTSEAVLTMGDFWTGNILISLSSEPHVDVVDWELAKPGLAGLDVGQFIAELHLLSVFHLASRESVEAILSSFLKAYRETSLKDEAFAQTIHDVARDAVTHLGVHLAVWTPRIPWGGKEQTRMVVAEGVEYLLGAGQGDDAWLKSSIVGGLLS